MPSTPNKKRSRVPSVAGLNKPAAARCGVVVRVDVAVVVKRVGEVVAVVVVTVVVGDEVGLVVGDVRSQFWKLPDAWETNISFSKETSCLHDAIDGKNMLLLKHIAKEFDVSPA